MCVCAPGRVNVHGELVKGSNAVSSFYIKPLDWSIIIPGTHHFLFSQSVFLLRLPCFLSPSLTTCVSLASVYCRSNDPPCSELSA